MSSIWVTFFKILKKFSMFSMFTKLLLIERKTFQVPLNTFLHFFAKPEHSCKTLDSNRVGKKYAKPAPKRAELRWRPTGQILVHFYSKTHENFSIFPMVIKLLLFARDVFEVPWNIFLYFFDTSGLSFETFDSRELAKVTQNWAERVLVSDEANFTAFG